jgi:DNA-binding PadR family transcriptional regulator
MWLGKILDLQEDLPPKLRELISQSFQQMKLTPLEFAILENIFNANWISGYDLIQNLNKHFAGTWEAKSGTIYPILSKLKRHGFLDAKDVKSPIGPLKTLYHLTPTGEEIIRVKVNNKNLLDQLKFVENYLVELVKIYIESISDEKRTEELSSIEEQLNSTFEQIKLRIHTKLNKLKICPRCGNKIDLEGSNFCGTCGQDLIKS